MKKSILACTLAAQIKNVDPTITRASAMKTAWAAIKSDVSAYSLLTFRKKDGTVCRRVVSTNWAQYQPVKGTGSPVKPGLKLFADIGKFLCGKNCIISTYQDNVISLAA